MLFLSTVAFQTYVWEAEVEYNMYLLERYITWAIYISIL